MSDKAWKNEVKPMSSMRDRILGPRSTEPSAATPPPPPPLFSAPADLEAYQAWRKEIQTTRRQPAMMIIPNGKGQGFLQEYSYLTGVMFDEGEGRFFALNFTTHSVIFDGAHLDQLVEPMAERAIRAFVIFNEKKHERPAAGAAIITGVRLRKGVTLETPEG